MSYLISSSASCKGSKTSSTRSSILSMKPVDKLGREILRLGMQISGGSLTKVTTGDVINNVETKKMRYKKLCDNTNMCLDKVHYCQVELATVTETLEGIRKTLNTHGDTSRAEKIKRLVNHDYLVVELLTGDTTEPKVLVQAEKIGFPEAEAGIHIDFCEEEQFTGDDAKNVTLYTIDCKQKKMGFEKVINVLENQNANYSVAEHNCWEYARSTTKRLLVACQESTTCNEEQKQERMRLQKEIDDLEARLATEHFKNNGKRLLRGLQKPLKGVFKSSSATSVAGTKQAVQTNQAAVVTAVTTHLDPALPPKAGDAQDESEACTVVETEAVEEEYDRRH